MTSLDPAPFGPYIPIFLFPGCGTAVLWYSEMEHPLFFIYALSFIPIRGIVYFYHGSSTVSAESLEP
jgi:hypothetical protein